MWEFWQKVRRNKFFNLRISRNWRCQATCQQMVSTIITRDDVVSPHLKLGSAFLSCSWESKIALLFLTFLYPEPVPKKLCDFYWLQLRISRAVMWKNCGLLAEILKMCRKIHICKVKGSGYVATENNQFLACYEVFQKWLSFRTGSRIYF